MKHNIQPAAMLALISFYSTKSDNMKVLLSIITCCFIQNSQVSVTYSIKCKNLKSIKYTKLNVFFGREIHYYRSKKNIPINSAIALNTQVWLVLFACRKAGLVCI